MDNAWLLLGIAKRRIGEFKAAIECFKTVTELKPSTEEAWGLYTVTLLDIGDFSAAEAVIEKAYELNPTNEKIRFYQENLIRIYIKNSVPSFKETSFGLKEFGMLFFYIIQCRN
jgi:tetratricopeptide (TPR) repeat protein